jgi:hypothetical protein
MVDDQMQSEISMLIADNQDASDVSFAKLVRHLGIDGRDVPLNLYLSHFNSVAEDIVRKGSCLSLSCSTLVKIFANTAAADSFKSLLREKLSSLFVFGFRRDTTHTQALGYLTDGIIKSVLSFENNDFKYEVGADFRDICQQFSGLSFGSINNQVDFSFDTGSQTSGLDSLITINKQPFFLRTRIGACEVFLLANDRILDIHASRNSHLKVAECFSGIVPAMMFLKYVFKDRCWHTDAPRACLIIDDPLLRDSYGFLNFRLLLESMRSHNFCTSIAFIPWNFTRTNKRVASLFKENADRLSLCVHGCDHSKHEFSSTDYHKVDQKVKLATQRMRSHENITGLTFDNVMVFPGGVASNESIKAVKSNNYVAAVYGQVIPPSSQSEPRMCDFMDGAVMHWDSFPLFTRRSPANGIANFALDLFMGKPALVYGHHDLFREGYLSIVELAKGLYSLDQNIEWERLGNIAKKSYWLKRESNDTVKIKLWASNSIIENTSNSITNYAVVKDEMSDVPIRAVLVNGKEFSYQYERGKLRMNIEVQPRQSAEVQIVYQDTSPCNSEECIKSNAKVLVRRYLSEIRDNYIAKNRLLIPFKHALDKL